MQRSMTRRAFLPGLALSAAALAVPALASEPKKKGGGPGYTQFPMMNVFTAQQGGRHGNLSLDMGLYEREFGPLKYVDFDEGLRRTIAWHRREQPAAA